MSCRELVERLIDFLDGELAAEEAQRLRAHLDECEPCVRYVRTYELTIQITRRLPPTPPPATLLERLRQAAQEEKS
jgi:mycothiol system anti-sigma-R factor